VQHYRQKTLYQPVVVAPDVGGAKIARGFAKRLDASLAIVDKRRPSANIAEVVNVVGEVDDRDCIMVDDLIDTGGTMAEGVMALKRLGANDVYCCASHALLSGPAADRLAASDAVEIAITNTIHVPEERRFERLKVLSVAPLLARAIRFTHSDQSVSSLFV
jgi:ribose-phosphate pyrophosphokinase